MAEPNVTATQYTVSCLPIDDPDDLTHAITVEYRGDSRWAVTRRGRRCLGADGRWDYESVPSERADEWLATHRFELDTALRLAREAVREASR